VSEQYVDSIMYGATIKECESFSQFIFQLNF